MSRLKQPLVVCMVLFLFIGCAGQPVKNNTQAMAPGNETAEENMTEAPDCEYPPAGTFYERNRAVITDLFIAALAVTEICLFWYLVDTHHDSGEPFLWIGPVWPVWR